MPSTYEPIATQTLGSSSSTITFSSIPATYTDLRLVLVGTGSTTLNVWLTFNNDSSSLYSSTHLVGDGSSALSSRQTSGTFIRLNANNAFNTLPAMITYDVFSYAGSTFKTLLGSVSADTNGGAATYVTRQVSLYRSTTAISRLDFNTSTGTFESGTIATLYGIKNA